MKRRGICTFLCPLKCSNSFISLKARLVNIDLSNNLFTFLIAQGTPVFILTAALHKNQLD